MGAGYYLCVHNYPGTGSLTFSLKATKDACRVSFNHLGNPLVCSTPRDAPEEAKKYSECSASGECICKPPYAKPVDNVYPNLGFESCATKVTMLSDQEASPLQPYTATEQRVGPQQWEYWGFNTTSDDYEVVITVAERGQGRVEPFIRFGVPPGASAGQFDERADWNPAPSERQHQIILDSDKAGTRSGLWFVGVFGAGGGGFFDLSLQIFSCPGNCSSTNGVCNEKTHQCTCNDGYGGADCSIFSKELTFNSTVDKQTSAVFEYEYFNMPPVTDTMLQGDVEVKLTIRTSSDAWNIHIAARPEFLVSLDPDAPGAYPTAKNFTQRVVLDLDRPHTLTLCSTQLLKGTWKAAIHNPLPNVPLNYTLVIEKVGRCLNGCSGHGGCSTDGFCECENGWLGGDCSVEAGGGGGEPHPPRSHPFWHFVANLILMGVGAAAAFAYIAYRGIPRWLPMRPNAVDIGLYQELTEGGI